jgi:ribosomal protein S18 acetylase RimI-like enzyme
MRADDIPAVLDIQSRCYDETKWESAQSFLSKLDSSPASCFMAQMAEKPVGYLVAVPAEVGSPPPLNSPTYAVPPAPNALYLHDMAVHPEARRAGVAVVLIEAYFLSLRRLNLQHGCLTAVNGSGGFWGRYGFRATPLVAATTGMATYGAGAQYMSVVLKGEGLPDMGVVA